MPQYYNPGLFPATYSYTAPYMQQSASMAPMPTNYMISVDG